MSRRNLPRAALLLFFTLALWECPLARAASPPECRDDLRDADGYTIRSVTVDARWVPPLALPIRPGDRFSNAKVQEAMEAVRRALRSERNETFELQSLGSAGVLHISRCLVVTDGRQVDVIIRPRYVRVDLVRVGSNILPIPRAPGPTFYEHVPRPILAFNPVVGLYQDEHYGVAPTFGIATNLLALPALLGDSKLPAAPNTSTRLDLTATGRKSIEHEFYDANVHLAFARERLGEFVQRLALEANYQGKDEPQGDDTFSRQALALGGSVRLKPADGLFRTVALGARYRWSDNRFSRGPVRADDHSAENAGEVRVLGEGRAAGGFLRAGLWADAAAPEERAGTYGRVAGLLAFEREFLVAANQTVGVEAVLGGGRAWGAPGYARFFGGNTDRNFLYDSLDSPAMAAFPNGPWIRSFGEGQALAQPRGSRRGAEGATAYWHLNLNVSLPIPALSRPLIPNEEVADGVTLKQLLKNKAGDSVSFYAVQLESEGLSPAAALAKARATYGEVKPAIEFIADFANVYALKPLLLFDVAGIEAPATGHSTRVAVGGGLQATIVTAKLEVGYMHTIVGEPGDRPGNFFARLVFQNLF